MAEINTTKLALAQQQLETAIGLFVSRRDRISAITLAGAADGILHGLVLKEGEQPFSDYAMSVAEVLTKETPAKAKYAKHINDTLNINDLKHMDENDENDIHLDPDKSALGAIMKAIANHHILVPKHPDFIMAMLQWSWMFYDGENINGFPLELSAVSATAPIVLDNKKIVIGTVDDKLYIISPTGEVLVTQVLNSKVAGSAIAADFDNDQDVDMFNMLTFKNAYPSAFPSLNYAPGPDFDADGDVDMVDMLTFKNDYPRGDCPSCLD